MSKYIFIKCLIEYYSKMWELRKEFTDKLLLQFAKEISDEFGFDEESLHMIHAELTNKYPDMDMETIGKVVDWGLLNSLGTMFDIELEELKKYFEEKL